MNGWLTIWERLVSWRDSVWAMEAMKRSLIYVEAL